MVLTVLIAFLIVLIAVCLLGIGWLISGKSRIRAGACGRDPHKIREEEKDCGTSFTCQLCDPNQEKKKNGKIQQK